MDRILGIGFMVSLGFLVLFVGASILESKSFLKVLTFLKKTPGFLFNELPCKTLHAMRKLADKFWKPLAWVAIIRRKISNFFKQVFILGIYHLKRGIRVWISWSSSSENTEKISNFIFFFWSLLLLFLLHLNSDKKRPPK